VLRTLKLIERRARWAGCPRPSGLTLARWYIPVARQTPGELCVALEGLISLADWAIHAPDQIGFPPPGGRYSIYQTCRCAVKAWTLDRFRHRTPSRTSKDATT
jgi:hypothetical protein